MKNSLYFLCSLLFSTTMLPIFDISPWIVIENKTKFNVDCKIQALYYPSIENEKITTLLKKDSNLNIVIDQEQDTNNNTFLKITINCICQAEQTVIIHPLLRANSTPGNPKLVSVFCTHKTLQIRTGHHNTHNNERYFCLDYQPEHGIILQAQPLSMYIKCMNNLKQTLRTIILAALNATDWLPY